MCLMTVLQLQAAHLIHLDPASYLNTLVESSIAKFVAILACRLSGL